MYNTIKACLFDLDGVLVDTAKYHFLAWKRLAEKLGIEFTEWDNEQLKGVSRVDSLKYILRKGNLNIQQEQMLQLMETKNAWYLEYVEGMHSDELLPNVEFFLNSLKSNGVLIGLGSSSKNAQMILDKTGIVKYFDTIVDGRHVSHSKPHPEVFLKGAQQLGVSPNQTIVFEDAASGVEAALAGGFFAIGIGDAHVLQKAQKVIPSLDGLSFQKLIALYTTQN